MKDYRDIVTVKWLQQEATQLKPSHAEFREAFNIDQASWSTWINGWKNEKGKHRPISKIGAAALWYSIKAWKALPHYTLTVPDKTEMPNLLRKAIMDRSIRASQMAKDTGLSQSAIRAWYGKKPRSMSSYAIALCYSYIRLQENKHITNNTK